MKYICELCTATVRGKGLDSHYNSTRCLDRQDAQQIGFRRGTRVGRKNLQRDLRLLLGAQEVKVDDEE